MNNKVKMTDICGNVSKFAPKFVIEYSMKSIFHAFCGLLVVALSLTSCLKSSDDTVTLYDDVAIKTFTLGTLNRYLHTTTSEGGDSVYKITYSASTYRMNIDQLNHTITNADSLLLGTDLAHVICNVTTKNNAVVYVKSLISDTLFYLSSGADSVNFTQPRVFRVFSTDGSGFRDYKVSLSARSQSAGVFRWTVANKEDFPVTDEKNMRWEDGPVDSTDIAMKPERVLDYVTWASGRHTTYTLLVGENAASEKSLVLWRKLTDNEGNGRWVYMPLAEDNPYFLPRMEHLALVYFKGSVLAFGSNGMVYQSRDQGITWKTNTTYFFPVGFRATSYQVAAVDDTLWLTDSTTGQTWKGKLTE